MGLLKKAVMGTAYAKFGIYGFAGAGKTRTGMEIAMGLSGLTKKKAVAFFDTEKGSDFMAPLAEARGIDFYVHKSKSFKELLQFLKEAQTEGVEVAVVDSISHIWKELCESYLKTKGRKYFTMQDWGILKGQWKEYTEFYINSPMHIIMLGRAGNEYETTTNEDTGKQEMIKSGTKMKTEGEMAFEPDMLVEMERIELKDGKVVNRAWVVKDRSDTMNGKHFDNPTFKTFKTYFDFIRIGGEHVGISQANSTEIFEKPDWSYEERKKRKEIAIETLQEVLTLGGLDGRSAETNKTRTEKLIKFFGSSSKTHIESMQVDELESAIQNLKIDLGLAKQDAEPPKLDTKEEII